MVKGVVITHGHEDHIGALPYLLREINVPVYSMKLTIGLIETKLKEATFVSNPRLHVVKPRQEFKVGSFRVELIRTCHSIPDSVAVAVHTPYGIILHSGDFKFDQTPVDGQGMDYQRIAELGNEGVLALLSDSTNVERAGYSPSEKPVGENLEHLFRAAKERIVVATFASNVHRIQQVINAAVAHGRKVAITGRSMVNIAEVAQEIGYLNVPAGTLIELDELDYYPRNQIVLLTTGSQGEPMSALSRMATSDHRQVRIEAGDTVILSASPIPGNEKAVTKVIYPGLKEHSGYEIMKKQSRGFGAMGTFNVTDEAKVKKILGSVKLIQYAESLGGVETLITYPTTQTHADVPEELRLKNGITPATLRLSVGIENAEDLIEDLKQAFKS